MPAASAADQVAALDQVVRARRAELLGLARREGLSGEDALDCVHDALCTFLRLGLEGRLPTPDTERGPYLAAIVVNAARNQRQRHHRSRPHVMAEALALADGGPSLEALVAHAEECLRLRTCVSRLCESQRTVVLMRLLEERPGEDVAAALGLTRGHVDVLIHRAKASLRVCMNEEDPRASDA